MNDSEAFSDPTKEKKELSCKKLPDLRSRTASQISYLKIILFFVWELDERSL